MSTITTTTKAPCCKCLRWINRDELTGNYFCTKCLPSLRGAKCRWCRGNLPIPENGKDPSSATCDNCMKLQVKYGPPVHCTLCKLEASFKTKRGSKVCRRCDYCIQNYGKAKPCQKCKVKAAWEGGKIEKINGLTLCFICTFREKRKSKFAPEKSTLEATKDDHKPKPKEKPKPKPKEDPTVVHKIKESTSEGFVDFKISEKEVIETMLVDEHTSASMHVNDLLLKVKEMNIELARRKKLIEEKDVCISSLKGTLTSSISDHERQRKAWESRIAERISEYKSKVIKLEFENGKLRKERTDRKKKNKSKKMAKQSTMTRNDPNAVKMELFNNSLRLPDRPSSRTSTPEPTVKRRLNSDSEEKTLQKLPRLAASSDESEKDDEQPEPKKLKIEDIVQDQNGESRSPSPSQPKPNGGIRKISSDTDDDVEATLKAIDEEEKKSYTENGIKDELEDSSSPPSSPKEEHKENEPDEVHEIEENFKAADSPEFKNDGPQTPEDDPPSTKEEEEEEKDETVPMLSDSSEEDGDDYVDTRYRW